MASASRFKRIELNSAQMKRLFEHARKAPLRHPPFDEKLMALMRKIKTALDEVFPQTLERWEEGFRQDMNPEWEIGFWLALADRYTEETQGKDLTLTQKRAVFKRLLGPQTIVMVDTQ